jgi:hypothetical protein
VKRGSTGTAVHWAEARSRVRATIDNFPVHCFIFDFQNVRSVLIAYILILDSRNFVLMLTVVFIMLIFMDFTRVATCRV